MVVCAMKGYEKLGKYLDLKGIIVSIIISLIMIFIANQAAWAIEVTKILNEVSGEVSFFDVYKNLFDILEAVDEVSGEESLISAFIGDLVMGYLLSIVASISYIIAAFKNVKLNSKVEKLD